MTDNQPIVGLIRQTDDFYARSREIYRPLDPSKRQIRLLHLLPGNFEDDVISVELKPISLDDNPVYTAISYSWGYDGSTLQAIDMEGASYQITPNQFMALKRFRHSERPRIMWMDVICINQADSDERSQQVRMMADIYQKCCELMIWLGESISPNSFRVTNEDSRVNLHTYELLGSERRTIRYPRSDTHSRPVEFDVSLLRSCDGQVTAFYALDLLSAVSETSPLPLDVLHSPEIHTGWLRALKALDAVLALPWWSRAWTFQETVLPASAGRRVAVHLGATQTPLVKFLNLGQLLAANLSLGPSIDMLLPGLNPWHHVTMLHTLSDSIRRHVSGVSLTFRDAYMISRLRYATDPHDKVYAFLGLLEDGMNLHVDYSCRLRDLFIAATRMAIKSSYFPHFLTFVSIELPNPRCLPSWCLDWALVWHNYPSWLRHRCVHLYEYSHQTASDNIEWIDADSDHMLMNAVEIGIIVARTQKMEMGIDRLTHERCLGIRRQFFYLQGIVLRDDEWQRLNFQDSDFEPGHEKERLDADALKHIASWERCGSKCDFLHCLEHYDVRIAFAAGCRSTRTFITECGNVGVGPQVLRVGDKLFYIPGHSYLYILRPHYPEDAAKITNDLYDTKHENFDVESQVEEPVGKPSDQSFADLNNNKALETYQVVCTAYVSNWASAIDGSRSTKRIRLA